MHKRCEGQLSLNFSGKAAITVPWFVGSVAPKTETNPTKLYCSKNLALRILRRSIPVNNPDGMAMCSRPRPVSNLSQTFWFPAQESMGGLGGCGLNVWRLMSVTVAWMALTHRTEISWEPVFDIVCSCRPHRMGQNLNLKMGMYGCMLHLCYHFIIHHSQCIASTTSATFDEKSESNLTIPMSNVGVFMPFDIFLFRFATNWGRLWLYIAHWCLIHQQIHRKDTHTVYTTQIILLYSCVIHLESSLHLLVDLRFT